ncbi:MAG: response regulator [Candidatus Micrarchaeota archaeon]|nr:response regulator [Candidatus Micrarchaeota archaeon]
MKGIEDVESDIMSLVNDKQEVTYNELKDYASSLEIDNDTLKRALTELVKASALASRSSGGIPTYYMLQEPQHIKRIFVIEDDQNINKLMTIALGSGYDVTQLYDGREAMEKIKFQKPDLVVLDLMLPGMDGLQICESIKKDQALRETTVIIVSAMDATTNRFKGIKYGADYYIKKPFDPDELRSLVTIFLKKKGKKFDPLIDLPNEDRISDSIEKSVKEADSDYEIGRLRVEGLASFASKFGNEAGITILRLASQLLQEKVKAREMEGTFVGFLNGDDFVIAGSKRNVDRIVESIKSEFQAVLPFIYQSEGYKPIEKGIEDIYAVQNPTLALGYAEIKRDTLMARRAEVIKEKRKEEIGSYTYDELRRMLGSENLDITITRDTNGVKLSVGKRAEKEE